LFEIALEFRSPEEDVFMLLKDRIALVTGSTHNIGLGIARAFSREGATVIVHSRHEEDAKKIADEIGGDHCVADVANPAELAALFDHICKQHGRLDILVNSVAHSTSGGVLDVSLDEWNRIMTVNLTGYFLCIQHAGKIMKEKGGGAIINISAGSGERSSPGGAAYSVSKGAINSLTRQAAADLAPYRIRVNGIISGLVGTPIGQKDMGARKPDYDMIPLRRIGQPEDVAEAAVFLASDRSSYITNTILPVDGGRLNAMTSGSSR
jgi:NAD(P)-dependent dehydrogenase (short-subunit alcohol dehydrogenase family)